MSYNNEGIISIKKLEEIMTKYGNVKMINKDYNTFRGSRNLKNRDIKVKEFLFILEKN